MTIIAAYLGMGVILPREGIYFIFLLNDLDSVTPLFFLSKPYLEYVSANNSVDL